MVRFFSKTSEPQPLSQITKRLRSMEKASVEQWWDTCHMSLGSSFDKWRFHGGHPEDVQESLDALVEIWQDLKRRSNVN